MPVSRPARHPARFIQIDVRLIPTITSSPLTVNQQSQQVTHCPGRNKQRSLLAHHLRVLSPQNDLLLIIAYTSSPTSASAIASKHFGRWPGHGIGTKVNVLHTILPGEVFL
jgi:hypothetical protein